MEIILTINLTVIGHLFVESYVFLTDMSVFNRIMK